MILIARPKPIIRSPYRVFRGGGWGSVDQFCRLPLRVRNGSTFRYSDLGFRVILRKKDK